ncbi:MAG: NAD-dependent DNA ligase LigA [Chitinophagales bacterium]|nr:NAD-dependent DNA ligase LigA [Chitinophagales bacterium]
MDLFNSSDKEKKLIDRTNSLLHQFDNLDATEDIVNYIQKLRALIREHDDWYYNQSAGIVSDKTYDDLFAKLNFLENEYPQYFSEDSPTQKIGGELNENFASVRHLAPMMSLENSYNVDDLKRFDKRVKDALPHLSKVDYAVELKYDGSSIAIVYENDRLVRAATRGNGLEGDDITENALQIKGIPHYANFSQYGIRKIEIRGEVVITLPDFDWLNRERLANNISLREQGKKELELFKNPRNTAAGSLRLKDANEVKNRKLSAILYQLGYVEDMDGKDISLTLKTYHTENIQFLQNLEFQTGVDSIIILSDIDAISEYCLSWQDKRDSYPIDIDGMVIKTNSIVFQSLIGQTSHHPKWAIAYKFKARQAFSILRKVDFQVGRTGAVTPVAKIDPIQLMGVEISSISLHNEDFIKEKEILLGDTVIVERAGDVIPYIVGVRKENRDGTQHNLSFPIECPSCHHHLVKPDGESVWRCIYPDCPAQIEERLIHFASVNAMDIQGLGQEIIRTFIREGIIHSIADIYNLDHSKILELEGFREKSVQNLINGIDKSKQNESWRLLTGLGIRHIGVTTAKMLVREVSILTEFEYWSKEKYLELKDIGPKVSTSLYEFFQDKENVNLINHLANLGVNIKSEEIVLHSSKLEGLTFLFTGTMPTLSRDEGKNLVEKNGGKVLSGVSANLNYLVAGEKAGSKLTKAEKIATIQIIDETTFLELIS